MSSFWLGLGRLGHFETSLFQSHKKVLAINHYIEHTNPVMYIHRKCAVSLLVYDTALIETL
jgi:hypothetical protein